MDLVVARIGAPHGLQGMVRLDVRTDDPSGRFAPGALLRTDPTDRGPLTVAASSERNGAWYVRFDEAPDRTAVEELRGTLLLVTAEDDAGEQDAWFGHQLVGLVAEDTTGRRLGTVAAVEHRPAQDLLVIAAEDGQRALVPFVRQIVPTVDVPGGRIVLDPPRGLLGD